MISPEEWLDRLKALGGYTPDVVHDGDTWLSIRIPKLVEFLEKVQADATKSKDT